MKNETPNKIHIIGSVGSGKTTLARKLSAKYDIPFFELDNVVWERHENGDRRRTEEEKRECLMSIFAQDRWIIEGVHNEEWVKDCFENAETIIFMDPSMNVRRYRIFKRFLKQRFGREKSNYKPTLKIFFKMYKWNKHFEGKGKANFFKKYKKYDGKIVVVSKKEDVSSFMK
ncbi:DNA topology modulation protein FlaR [Halalkalibacillus sediminis]|uniref:DNA topology modulation protein FlaR n=1 Tax=Halalkalibacillus sediminis TaxID=2018042 RepID=A0A2I0QR22_9BACI|nr:shikimate kinase [Halalkalibacillus sediminis]PKR76781.1 DNA topology modulation protein FlaR [Halalkalibacillus sediminis]